MIICQCTQLTHRELAQAIAQARALRPDGVITPGLVLAQAGVRMRCGGCMPTIVAQIQRDSHTPPQWQETPPYAAKRPFVLPKMADKKTAQSGD